MTRYPPDDGLNSYNSPQLGVDVSVTLIDLNGYVLDGEDHKDLL
jgi:hypothetical protein